MLPQTFSSSMSLEDEVPHLLGQTLRLAREAHGMSVEEVARVLRIKAAYLHALENGQHERLPGTAYALGFLRTYAEYLGLDGLEQVRRFKAETAVDQGPPAPLIFPSPAPSGRVPGMVPLLIALALLFVITGTWFFWRNETYGFLSNVPEVPERLRAIFTAPLLVAETAISSKPLSPADPPIPPPVPPQPMIQTSSESARPLALPVPQPVPLPVPPPPALDDPLPPPPADVVARPVSAPPMAPPVPPASALPSGEGRVFGSLSDPARVIIRSKGDSWIQVRDSNNQPILSRMLRDGDQYRVPNRQGLTLMTGNAGVLEITVDGAPAPSLGFIGQVRRFILLNPDSLMQGAQE